MSESETLENIGGFPYILDYLSVYLPYTVISGTSAILGLIGNAILISSVLISKKLRTNPTCILITNIAMADIFISLIVHPSTVAGVLLGKTFFDKHMALCESLGSLCLISCVVSLITMGFLALNRYVCIIYLFKYKKLFSIGNTIKMCFLTWTIGFLVDMPNFFGIGAHVYDLKTLTCHFDRLKIHFTVPLVIFCIFLPGIVIGSLHMRIYISTSSHSDLRRKQFASQYHYTLSAVRVARSLFITFIVFFICWIPFSIVLISDTKDKMPIWLHTFANSAAHFHSSLNPIIYLLTNPLIRGGYRNLMRALTCDRLFADEIDENYSRTNRLTNRTVMYHSSANAADAQQLEIE